MNLSALQLVRKSDVASAFLAAIVLALVAISSYLYFDVSEKMADLNNGIKEDALWAVYQLDSEAHKFSDFIRHAPQTQSANEYSDQLKLRYDTLRSKSDLLLGSEYSRKFKNSATYQTSMKVITSIIRSAESRIPIPASQRGDISKNLDYLRFHFAGLTNETSELLHNTNAAVSFDRAKRRVEVSDGVIFSKQIFLILIPSVIVLFVLLRKQIYDSRRISHKAQQFAEELEEAYVLARSGNRAKSSFIATISHEIRTPLNTIIGLAELLNEKPLPKEVLKDVSSIKNSGEILLEVLNEVLDYSAIENGNLQVECRSFDFEKIIQETLDMFKMSAEAKGIQLTLLTAETLCDNWIKSDPTRIRQVLMNLVGNAIKFTQAGSISVHAECKPGESPEERILHIEVRDTGGGIGTEGKERLFKPFSQVDSAITRKYGGTGLGLSICKGIVERLSGKIGVESQVGVGSTFWFEIPVRKAEKTIVSEVPKTQQGSVETKRILLVEDNPSNRYVATAMLKGLGQHVDYASDGSEAVKRAARQAYDLIFMDMQMPVMSGIEATRVIREGNGPNSKTPIIAMTANASELDKQLCQVAGMNEFESKPVRKAKLVEIIHRYTGARQLTKASRSAASSPHGDRATKSTSTLTSGLNTDRSHELLEELGQKVYDELWTTFCDEAVELDKSIQKALSGGNMEEARANLHTLKGAALNMGLEQLANLADEMRNSKDHVGDMDALHQMIMHHVGAENQITGATSTKAA